MAALIRISLSTKLAARPRWKCESAVTHSYNFDHFDHLEHFEHFEHIEHFEQIDILDIFNQA